jgi:hypothetical protein
MDPNSDEEIQLKQEMDVIITVLNRIFDEDNIKYYIGSRYNSSNFINHKQLNTPEEIPLNNMNRFILLFIAVFSFPLANLSAQGSERNFKSG